MQKDKTKYESNMADKRAAARSSGLPNMGDAPQRGALAAPAPSKARASDNTRPAAPRDPPNQKYGLLRTLLTMGAIRPAIFILSKFPWLPMSHPEVADLFLHMIRLSIAHICAPISPAAASIREKSRPNLDRTIIETGSAPKSIPKKKLIVVHAPTPPSNQYTDFTYFYPAWLDTVPICTTRREVFTVIEPMLRYVRVNAYRDMGVLTQLCRIGKAELSEVIVQIIIIECILSNVKSVVQAVKSKDDALIKEVQSQWRTMLRLYLLPGLSMTRANAAFNVEVWSVLRFYEQTERWGMYGEWADAQTLYPEVAVRHIEVRREVLGILRRVTVNTNNKLSLPLAKLAHSNPCLVFTECVKQAMAYDNLIEAIAESARALTALGYDVLMYAILTAFSDSRKPRMKDDGTSVSLWLMSKFLF